TVPVPPPPSLYTLSLHDALPIYIFILPPGDGGSQQKGIDNSPEMGHNKHTFRIPVGVHFRFFFQPFQAKDSHREKRERGVLFYRSEEHTSELQSRFDLVCRLLLA